MAGTQVPRFLGINAQIVSTERFVRMDKFMKDRYGADELTIVLGIAGVVLALIGSIAQAQWLSWIAIFVIVVGVARGLSKNIDARRKENESFVSATAKIPGLGKFVSGLSGGATAARSASSAASGASKQDFERTKRQAKQMWKKRKTNAFLKCPNCGQMLSVPKGKGKIIVTCPKCHTKMETRS